MLPDKKTMLLAAGGFLIVIAAMYSYNKWVSPAMNASKVTPPATA